MKKNNNLKRNVKFEKNTKNKRKKENTEVNNSISKSDLHKPPTVQELNQLRETEILFNSNLFRLQTEELVKEVSIKEKRKREINSWVDNLKIFVSNIPEYSANLSDFNASLEHSQRTPLKGFLKKISKNKPLHLKTDQDAPVKLIKPQCIQIVGLYPLNATIGPTVHVTVNVVMPKSCFHAKDYLNARYLVKRSLYLSYIATHLKGSDLVSNVSYTFLNGNHLHPMLQITSNAVKKTVFEVLLSPEEETFKLSRFHSDKSNLRWSYWNDIQTDVVDDDDEQSATPWYNAMLAWDCTLGARDLWARAALQGLVGAHEALQLLAVWLRQRELQVFSEALLLQLLASLAHTGRLNRHMSSYQVLRNVWVHLAQTSWDSGFFDHTATCNLAANLPAALFSRVRQEAQLALTLLDSADLRAFHTLFMTRMPFCLQYDAIINIFNAPDLENIYEDMEDKCKLDYLTFRYPLIVEQITQALQTGLNDRVTCIVPQARDNPVWTVGSDRLPDEEDALYVSFGLRLNISNMFRVVDKGPPAYDAQATTFRNFWGEKAELRRFKDGSICEAVFWSFNYVRDKRKICKYIIEYVLKDKFKLESYNIVYDQFDSILANKIPVEEGNLKVVSEFDELAKKLRELKLPLSISSMQGISEAFSHSDAFPSTPRNYQAATAVTYVWQNTALLKDKQPLKTAPEFVAPVKAVIQMVQHSKWPSELEAMRALRTAFYLQMADQLHRSDDKFACRVYEDHLDVVSGGLVMRLDLFHPKELALLDVKEAEARELRCVVLPRLRGALAGLHARCPALGPAGALARRWLRTQLLDVPAAVIELLCAAALLPLAENGAALPQRAFLQFLALVAEHAWVDQPLVVDITGELTVTQRDELDAEFRRDRATFPPLCVVTPWDMRSRVSGTGPSAPELQRLRLLAAQSLQLVQQQAHSRDLFVPAALFKPNLGGYNVLIHLKPLLNARRYQALGAQSDSTAEYDSTLPNQMPVVNFNPAELYLHQLRENYSDFAVFFHDIHGGNMIAVLWKPNILEKHDFKIQQVGGMKLERSKQKLEVNINAIIEDFYILGEGIIKNIQIM